MCSGMGLFSLRLSLSLLTLTRSSLAGLCRLGHALAMRGSLVRLARLTFSYVAARRHVRCSKSSGFMQYSVQVPHSAIGLNEWRCPLTYSFSMVSRT